MRLNLEYPHGPALHWIVTGKRGGGRGERPMIILQMMALLLINDLEFDISPDPFK